MSNDEIENIKKLILSEDPELKDLGWEYIKQTIDIDKLSRELFEYENIKIPQWILIKLLNLPLKNNFPSTNVLYLPPYIRNPLPINTLVGIILLSL